MSNLVKLKPCPFCGGVARHWINETFGEFVRCNKCDAKTGYYGSKGAATKAWNKRIETEATA